MLKASFCNAFILLAFVTISLRAQETAPAQRSLVRIGIWGHAAWQQHRAQFTGLINAGYPQEPYSAELVNMRLLANPFQWSAGALGEIPVWESDNALGGTSVGVAARLGAQTFGATFTSSLNNVPIAGLPALGAMDFTLQTNALFLNAEPLLQWKFAQNRVAIMAGMQFASLFRETTAQSRRLRASQPIPPEIRQPIEDSVSALLGSGVFGRPIVSSVVAGVSWEIPLTANGALLLVPEAFYTFGLSNLSTNLRAEENQSAFWRLSTLRAGFALKFAPEKPPIPPPEPPATLENTPSPVAQQTPPQAVSAPPLSSTKGEPEPPLRVKIAAIEGVEPDGRRAAVQKVRVEEFLGSSSRFLLPYIFFQEQSATLPERYKSVSVQERSTFTPEKLIDASFVKDHELDVYYHLLNIVGYRMRKYPAARLTLTGYTDIAAESADKTSDKTSDKTLSLRRAEAVKEYLMRVWEIPASRITTKSGGARGLAETIDAEENRLVEMQATTPEIFDELRYDYTLRTVQPAKLEITPDIAAPKGLAAWTLKIDELGVPSASVPTTLQSYEGRIVPSVISSGMQRLFADTSPSADSLSITLRARDNAASAGSDAKTLGIEYLSIAEKQRKNSPDVRVGTYWVFCFNLNSKQILVDERVRRAVQGITALVTPGASVEITGYSDTRGDLTKNRKLSDDRAEAVLQLLRSPLLRVPSSKIANVEGKGESVFYDNDLPEGRFYNRFVRVDVRTPVMKKR